jgi:hypothetical protein
MDLIRGLMWLVLVVCLIAIFKSSAVGCVQTETYSEYRRNSRFEDIRELLSEFSLMSVMKWILNLALGDSSPAMYVYSYKTILGGGINSF